MCFMMSKEDLFLIYKGLKTITMRKVTDRHKEGRVYQVKLNLFDDYSFKIRILSREVVDLNEMDDDDFVGVGYSKEEYLTHSYNTKNNSTERIKYVFEVVEVNDDRLKEIGII